MSKLPQVSGKNCLKALSKVGFFVKRQKGSHIIVCRNDPFAEVVIPNHKTLDKELFELSFARPRNVESRNKTLHLKT